MAQMAKWSTKIWEVSSKKIVAINSIAIGVKLNTENNDDKAGSPATSTKAIDIQSMTFDFDLAAAAGCDTRSEYESWTALIGECSPFYLAGSRFGPANFQLTAVNLTDTLLDSFGRILKGRISITLTEYAEEASGKKSSAGGSNKPNATAVSNGTGPPSSAVSVGASSGDKATKKPNNTQLTS